MRPRHAVFVWAVVVGGSLLVAMGIAPAVHAALLAWSPDLSWKFSRVFNRTAMVAAAVALIGLRRSVGWDEVAASWRRSGRHGALREGLVGLSVALVVVALAVAWAISADQLVPAGRGSGFFARRIQRAIVGSLASATIEELFFRGLMLLSLVRDIGWRAALVSSSAVYSAVHLLVSDRTFVWSGYSPEAGVVYFLHAVERQAEIESLAPLAGLFLSGLVLGLLVQRTSSLWLVTGLHAGWACGFYLLRHATLPAVYPAGASELASGYFLLGKSWSWLTMVASGWIAVVVLTWWGRRSGGERRPPAGR